jgi:branched-chain amino acid transport system ATP-binding protein
MQDVFELFPNLRERLNQLGGTLSGGEQQMLAIARALMTGPRLLVLDEPSEGLSPSVIRRIESQMADMRRSRQSALLVEQNLSLALNLADRVCILDQGRIVFDDQPNALDRTTIDTHLAV